MVSPSKREDMREYCAPPGGIHASAVIHARARALCRSYLDLCDRFLPVCDEDSAWRHSRRTEPTEPEQGWKLHLSATILTANEVLEKVAPFLHSQGVHFKAPVSLQELDRINCGIYYGYSQVGKFITVYPRSDREAVSIARRLHRLTLGISAPAVPFDLRYRQGSSVYYRYGAFTPLNLEKADGTLCNAIRDPSGKLVPDSRHSAESPAWVVDPFIGNRPQRKTVMVDSPLSTTFRAFRALSQRGKGGVYQAVDLSVSPPRLCLLKQGRPGGEVGWDGRDGRWRVRHEELVLGRLRSAGIDVPRIYSSFESEGNYYLVTEFIDGDSLQAMVARRRKRLTIAQVLSYAISISLLISRIHAAGWIWRDCKPAHLILTTGGQMRPLDFEGACPIDQLDPFTWNTPEFAPPECEQDNPGESRAPEDLYALGAITYYLITGQLPKSSGPVVPMEELRRGIPETVRDIVSELLARDPRHRPGSEVVVERLKHALATLGSRFEISQPEAARR